MAMQGGVGPGTAGPDLATTLSIHTHNMRHRSSSEKDDQNEMALMEEMEEFALESMEKTLRMLDGLHLLLIAVASVRELGSRRYPPWEGEGEFGGPGDVERSCPSDAGTIDVLL